MAMSAEPRGGRCLIALLLPALIALTALAILVAQAVALLRGWDPGVRETPPTFSSPGPTVVQLERLRQLVSTRVHVADVLVGESRWLEGSWIIQGDALLAVDMSKAEVKDRDEKARTATIILPHPAVLSARVNHEWTQQWDVKSRSWTRARRSRGGLPRPSGAFLPFEAPGMALKAVADPSNRKSIRSIRRIRPSGPFCEFCELFPPV